MQKVAAWQRRGIRPGIAVIVLFFAIGSLGLGSPPVSAAPEPVLQVSIAVLETNEELAPLSALVQVELSRADLVLVERAELDKVLREQALSAAALVDREALVKVGRLLRADGFVLLSLEAQAEEKPGLLRVRLAETGHGIRLLDHLEEWDPEGLEGLARAVCGKVTEIVPKLRLAPGEAVPVGIVDVHRVQLGEEHQWLCRALKGMLSARLSKEPRIIVLEREDLLLLQDEKVFTGGQDAEFWRSGVLVEGQLHRSASNGDMELVVFLRRPGQEIETLSQPVEAAFPQEAVDRVAAEVVPHILRAPPEASWDPEEEAAEFFRQGQLLRNHRRFSEALPIFETASALAPENQECLRALFSTVWDAYLRRQRLYTDLQLAELVSRLVRRLRAAYETHSYTSLHELVRSEPFDERIFLDGYFTSPASVATGEVKAINRENRIIWEELARMELKRHYDRYRTGDASYRMQILLAVSDTPEQAIASVRKAASQLLMSPEMGGIVDSPDKKHQFLRAWLLFPPIFGSAHLRDDNLTFERLWVKYLQELTKSSDALVKYTACLALAGLKNAGYRRPTDGKYVKWLPADLLIDYEHYCQRALHILQNNLNTPDEPFGDEVKCQIRDQVKFCMKSVWSLPLEDRAKVISALEELFDPLIKRGDARNLALWKPGSRIDANFLLGPAGGRNLELAERYLRLMQRVIAVLGKHAGDKKVGVALERARDARNEIVQYYRRTRPAKAKQFDALLQELQAPRKPMDLRVEILLSRDQWPRQWRHVFDPSTWRRERTVLRGGVLWVAFVDPYFSTGKVSLGLAGIDLEDKEVLALWQADCPRWRCQPRAFTGLVVGEAHSYVALKSVGLVQLPGSRARGAGVIENPTILAEQDGLPSVMITGLAAQGDRLWVAYGDPTQSYQRESGLGVYDPRNRDWKSIFCSALKSDAPFCDGKVYALRELGFFGRRLYFHSQGAHRGMWRLDTSTGGVECLHEGRMVGSQCTRALMSEPCWLFQDVLWLVRFEPAKERATIILGNPWSPWEREKSTLVLEEHQFVPEDARRQIGWGPFVGGGIDLSTAAVHGDELWARYGVSHIMILKRGRDLSGAEIIENDILDGGKVIGFVSTPYGLIALGKGSVGLIETQ